MKTKYYKVKKTISYYGKQDAYIAFNGDSELGYGINHTGEETEKYEIKKAINDKIATEITKKEFNKHYKPKHKKEYVTKEDFESLKQRIEKLEAERDHSKKQCELILNNVENKILNYLDHAKKQDDRISKLEKQEKPIEELHAEHRGVSKPKKGDVVKAWDRDKNKFVFGVISRIDDGVAPYKLELGDWYFNAEHAPEEVAKHFKK